MKEMGGFTAEQLRSLDIDWRTNEKLEIIASLMDGLSITDASIRFSFSVTYIYKMLKEYQISIVNLFPIPKIDNFSMSAASLRELDFIGQARVKSLVIADILDYFEFDFISMRYGITNAQVVYYRNRYNKKGVDSFFAGKGNIIKNRESLLKAKYKDRKMKAITDVARGMTRAATAKKYGIAVGTLYNWIRSYNEE